MKIVFGLLGNCALCLDVCDSAAVGFISYSKMQFLFYANGFVYDDSVDNEVDQFFWGERDYGIDSMVVMVKDEVVFL